MPSTLLESRPAERESAARRDLLVLWQHPETREIVPIGRLSYDGVKYAFSYTNGAMQIPHFRPLPGLQDLRRRYESDRLPPVFGQRIMESDRPDYSEYMLSLGLDPSRATPWEQITNSAGSRAGDTLQFMELPTIRDGRVYARFLTNGIRHIAGVERVVGGRSVKVSLDDHERSLASVAAGELLQILPETGNDYDRDATVISREGTPLGYVPRLLTGSVRELLTTGPLVVVAARVAPPGTPPHLRLVVDLDTEAPAGFIFDRNQQWETVNV